MVRAPARKPATLRALHAPKKNARAPASQAPRSHARAAAASLATTAQRSGANSLQQAPGVSPSLPLRPATPPVPLAPHPLRAAPRAALLQSPAQNQPPRPLLRGPSAHVRWWGVCLCVREKTRECQASVRGVGCAVIGGQTNKPMHFHSTNPTRNPVRPGPYGPQGSCPRPPAPPRRPPPPPRSPCCCCAAGPGPVAHTMIHD